MVYIEVHDGDSLDLRSVGAHQVRGCNSHIVDVAESVCLLLIALVVTEGLAENASMVTWRSDRAERILEVT